MKYTELQNAIASGEVNTGDKVYICDYRFNDIDNKAIRHVKPQEVVLCSNFDLPENKKVYYSNHHFKPLNKKGKMLSKIIVPYDNTGYRSYTGVSLNIFLTMEECIEFYTQQCNEIIKMFEEAKISKVEYFDAQINEIKSEIESL